MSIHLLPCNCGNSVQLSTAAAGTELACDRCGQILHAPRLAELMALPPFVAPTTKQTKVNANTHAGRARRRTMLLIWMIVLGFLFLLGLVPGFLPAPGFLVMISVPLLLAWIATIFVHANTWQALVNRIFLGTLIAGFCYWFAFAIGAEEVFSSLRYQALHFTANQWMFVTGLPAVGFAVVAVWVLELATRTASHQRRGFWITAAVVVAIIVLQGMVALRVITLTTTKSEDVVFSLDGNQIIAMIRNDFGRRVVAYDIAQDSKRTVYSRRAGRFEFGIQLAESGDRFLLNEQVSHDHRRRCVVFDISSGNQVCSFEPPQFHRDATFSRDGKWIATEGSWDAAVWSAMDGKWQRNFASDHDRVASSVFLGRSNRMAIGYESGSVLIWPLERGLEPIKLTNAETGYGLVTLFNSDDESVLVGVHGIQMKAVLDLVVWDIGGRQPELRLNTFEPDKQAANLPADQLPVSNQAIVFDYDSRDRVKMFVVGPAEVFHRSFPLDGAKDAIARLSPDKKSVAILDSRGRALSIFDENAQLSRRVVFVSVWPIYLLTAVLGFAPVFWEFVLRLLHRRQHVTSGVRT